MKVEIQIDKSCNEPKAVIYTDKITEEITSLVERFSKDNRQFIVGQQNDVISVLYEKDITRIYAQNGRVIASGDNGEYTLKIKLYEAEEILNGKFFVRISKSEIINLKKVKNFDLSITGTICVSMKDGSVTYVSRRYVSKIKKALGL